MTHNQKLYAALSAQKDSLFIIMNRMKKSWGRDVWVQLHNLTAICAYADARALVLEQHKSKSRQTAIACIDAIISISTKLHFAC